MGVIKKLKSPNRVLVCIGCGELIDEIIGVNTGEQFRFGQIIRFIAAAKLHEKKVDNRRER